MPELRAEEESDFHLVEAIDPEAGCADDWLW